MAEFKGETFKFPDEAGDNEVTVEVEGETPEIEIVDDTPPEDRNRRPMTDPPQELTDEELDKYDESVKHRIKHFTKGYHEERRAKEAAQREREEAIRIAQAVVEENKKLKGSLSQGQSALLEQAKKVVANELEKAQEKYIRAYESGDSAKLVEAQTEIAAITLKADKVENFRSAPLQEERNAVQIPQPIQQAPQPDYKALSWRDKNPWFGQDRRMTSYALAVHEELTKEERINPSSDEYYQRLDAEIRQRFPDRLGLPKQVDAPPPPNKSSVVAPATRSAAPKKLTLTKSQENIAKRLGVPLNLYAQQVAEEFRKGQ
jgi:hypothetical protein